MDQNQSSVGSIIGTIIIIALIVLGGLYFWGKRIEEQRQNQNAQNGATTTTIVYQGQSEADQIKEVGTGDDLNSIDSDLQATNMNNLDAELQ